MVEVEVLVVCLVVVPKTPKNLNPNQSPDLYPPLVQNHSGLFSRLDDVFIEEPSTTAPETIKHLSGEEIKRYSIQRPAARKSYS